MPDRAEESFVSLEKGDVTVGDRGIFKFLQRVTLLFFFAKKKKRSKKRKAYRLPLLETAVYHTTGSVTSESCLQLFN